MRKITLALVVCSLFAILDPSSAALAQTSAAKPGATSSEKPNLRFFQQFITDAAIVDKQWYGIEFRWQNGAVPPIESADGILLTPTIAINPVKNLEVGGMVSFIDYELDHDIVRPGTSDPFSGDSGLGDLTAWGKYRILNGPVTFSAGALLTLPTGSEDEGLGTGEVTPGVFASFRAKAGDGYFMGNAAMRIFSDATILNIDFDGQTSAFLGGGYIWEAYEGWVFSGELTVESEHYDELNSDFRATAGVQYVGFKHHYLRGATSIGLTDGAPDFELILGYAYSY